MPVCKGGGWRQTGIRAVSGRQPPHGHRGSGAGVQVTLTGTQAHGLRQGLVLTAGMKVEAGCLDRTHRVGVDGLTLGAPWARAWGQTIPHGPRRASG